MVYFFQLQAKNARFSRRQSVGRPARKTLPANWKQLKRGTSNSQKWVVSLMILFQQLWGQCETESSITQKPQIYCNTVFYLMANMRYVNSRNKKCFALEKNPTSNNTIIRCSEILNKTLHTVKTYNFSFLKYSTAVAPEIYIKRTVFL